MVQSPTARNCTNFIKNSTEEDAMDCIHTLFLVSSFLFCHTDLTDLTDLYSYDNSYIVGR